MTHMSTIGRLLLVTLVAVACRDDNVPTYPKASEAIATPERLSYVVVSDSVLPAGASLVVSGNVDAAGGGEQVASFVARLRYDAGQLEFVSDDAVPGVMRAVNALDSVVVIAGASATGIPDSRLFVLHFRARIAITKPTLALTIGELNTVRFTSRIAKLRPLDALRLDRSLR